MKNAFYIVMLAATSLRAAGYCSLLVNVQDRLGKEIEAQVVVEEENGYKTTQTTRRGSARFCGLGITPVSVIVGNPECNQVTVRNVPLVWNKPQTVLVIHDNTACQGEKMPVAACSFLLRFADINRNPIVGVTLQTQKPFSDSHVGDEY